MESKTSPRPVSRLRQPASAPTTRTMLCAALLAALAVTASTPAGAAQLDADDFESGLSRWTLTSAEQIAILLEPGTDNHVLRLAPKPRGFAHAIFSELRDLENVRFEGRFLFPTEGDGYLGFLYNFEEGEERTDFGCLYVKSNGSYVRVSPHMDGNPSWRLYEEMRRDLEGDRRIRTGVWYWFRLDVRGRLAELSLGESRAELDMPVVRFDGFPRLRGALGLEARPGRGEPVWVDDVTVSSLEGEPMRGVPERAETIEWEMLGPFAPGDRDRIELPELPELPAEGWRRILPDRRGAILTGLETQFRSGEKTILYLRTRLSVTEDEAVPTWLGLSAANQIDVWFRGFHRGTVAPEQFIWADFATSPDHPGARVPVAPKVGDNELILRVDGDNFAGGGFYAEWIVPGAR